MNARIRCPVCQQFYRTERLQCPRCLAPRPDPDVAPAAEKPRAGGGRMGFALALASVIAAGLAVAWVLVRPVSFAVATPVAAEAAPPAGRAARDGPHEPVPPASPSDDAGRPFLESMGEGRIAYGEGRGDDALAAFTRALEAAPDNVDALNGAAQVLVRLGRPIEALPLLRRAVDAAPARWDLQFNLGRALGEAGRWREAVDAYRQAATLKPDDVYTAFNLARALDRAGDSSALAAFEGVIASVPDEPSFHLALALASQRQGNWDGARLAFGRYRELLPDEGAEAAKVARHLKAIDGRGAESRRPAASTR